MNINYNSSSFSESDLSSDSSLTTSSRKKLFTDLSRFIKDSQEIIRGLGDLQKKIDQAKKTDLHSIKQKFEKNELLNNLIKQMQKVSGYLASNPVSSEELPLIFEIENQMRMFLAAADNFPGKEKYQEIYDQAILPQLQQAKKLIKKSPFQFASLAAASKGKALQAGLKALTIRASAKPAVRTNTKSEQQVFLLSEEGTVFKKSKTRVDKEARADEEERNANALFDIMSPQSTVGTFFIRKASLNRFGMGLPFADKERGYALDKVPSDTLKKAILEKVSQDYTTDGLKAGFDSLVEKLEEPDPVSTARQRARNYQFLEKQKWSFRASKTDEWQEMSLKKLQKLYLADKLSIEGEIAPSSDLEGSLSLETHILTESSLFRALNYLPSLKPPSKEIYLTPDLNTPKIKKNYEFFEKFNWIYKDKEKKMHKVNFKTLHAAYLADPENVHSFVTPSGFTRDDVLEALKVGWRIASTELMILDASKEKPEVEEHLTHIQAKPFIKDMVLMTTYPLGEIEFLLKKLSPKAQFNAILTGEVQLLDLHAANLGLIPVPNPEYERFNQHSFQIGEKRLTLNQLIKSYLNKEITSSTSIQFMEKNEKVDKPLKELPELEKALNVQWEFVLFDTDLSISESSQLQFQIKKTIINGQEDVRYVHSIPLRSVLFQTEWRDEPLDEEVVQQLLDSTDRDLRVKQWMKRADAPIYQQLSPTTKEALDTLLESSFESLYSLSVFREQRDSTATLKTVQESFVDILSSSANLEHALVKEIWETLQEDLSSVVIKPGDTFETIAKRYHQKVEDLTELNPSTTILVPGEKIKIECDFLSISLEAEKRKAHIAQQLFPRLSLPQQKALIERQTRRSEYLKNYQQLKTLNLTEIGVEKALEQLEKMLQSSHPLNSLEKANLLERIEKLKISKSSDDVQKLINLILLRFQPTYFNLMKVMIPLLADAHALNEELYGEQEGSIRIGHPRRSLEESIEDASKSTSMKAKYLADILSHEIRECLNPSFR